LLRHVIDGELGLRLTASVASPACEDAVEGVEGIVGGMAGQIDSDEGLLADFLIDFSGRSIRWEDGDEIGAGMLEGDGGRLREWDVDETVGE